MATSGKSSSLLRSLSSSSSSQRSHNHHHQQRSSSSQCNLNLRLKISPGGGNNTAKSSSAAVSNNQKRKCLCSPTTHPGSFRCGFHRRLEKEKIGNRDSPARVSSGLDLRKVALMNSLARIGSVEAERLRRSLAATLVKPSSSPSSSLQIHRRRLEFRPRLSRFYTVRKDQD